MAILRTPNLPRIFETRHDTVEAVLGCRSNQDSKSNLHQVSDVANSKLKQIHVVSFRLVQWSHSKQQVEGQTAECKEWHRN